jgi:hypothetical protein
MELPRLKAPEFVSTALLKAAGTLSCTTRDVRLCCALPTDDTVATVTDIDHSNRLILWVAISTAVMAAVSLAMAVTTLPRSGPYCQSDCVGYPYIDAAEFVPRDYLWIYPALVLWLLVIVLVQCIHSQVDPDLRVLSGIAVTFSAIGVGTLIVDYAVQLTFIQPALLLGETEGIAPWSQYNPYGIFIALENVGYVLLNLAFLALGLALIRRPARLWRVVAWIFTIAGALTLALLLFYSALYGFRLDYRFEVTAILITWLVLIATPVLLSIALVRSGPIKGQRTAQPEISNRS